ncbi:hypothetical protein [Halobacillus sp. A5]|uniref:hypothetical protein n=1 Tax=Halobacillus sp. A5 TaxID=2880263 RepID=UPI0020A68A53|nr:hypothetical protein [Halobacillus sp. A5]MCP3028496.1 hypothetical protein [Halobacillus sp. A5]
MKKSRRIFYFLIFLTVFGSLWYMSNQAYYYEDGNEVLLLKEGRLGEEVTYPLSSMDDKLAAGEVKKDISVLHDALSLGLLIFVICCLSIYYTWFTQGARASKKVMYQLIGLELFLLIIPLYLIIDLHSTIRTAVTYF